MGTSSFDVRPYLLVFVAVGAFLFFSYRLDHEDPVAPPEGGPDLVRVFEKSSNLEEAAHHAKVFGMVCQSVADILREDGKKPEPYIKFGSQADDFRMRLREMRFRGSLGQKYPDLGPFVNEFLTEEIGTWGGPLDEPSQDDAKRRTHRQRWIDAYEKLAQSALYADYALRH